MEIKYNNSFLKKLEKIFHQSDFELRYEKGSFKAGYCILNQKKVVVVNKYFSLEGKINCLIELIKEIKFDQSNFTEEIKELYALINQTSLKFGN